MADGVMKAGVVVRLGWEPPAWAKPSDRAWPWGEWIGVTARSRAATLVLPLAPLPAVYGRVRFLLRRTLPLLLPIVHVVKPL